MVRACPSFLSLDRIKQWLERISSESKQLWSFLFCLENAVRPITPGFIGLSGKGVRERLLHFSGVDKKFNSI